jgi:hypothetical protein
MVAVRAYALLFHSVLIGHVSPLSCRAAFGPGGEPASRLLAAPHLPILPLQIAGHRKAEQCLTIPATSRDNRSLSSLGRSRSAARPRGIAWATESGHHVGLRPWLQRRPIRDPGAQLPSSCPRRIQPGGKSSQQMIAVRRHGNTVGKQFVGGGSLCTPGGEDDCAAAGQAGQGCSRWPTHSRRQYVFLCILLLHSG